MTANGPKTKSKAPVKRPSKKKKGKSAALAGDPNAVHDIYNDDNLDPAYDKMMGDDVLYDRDEDETEKNEDN